MAAGIACQPYFQKYGNIVMHSSHEIQRPLTLTDLWVSYKL